jgi:hypothetical protein
MPDSGKIIYHLTNIMEAERINAISNTLSDLAEREAALRGYL